MNNLALSESRFQDFVIGGDTAIASEILAPDAATLNIRIGIYYDAYRSRLSEVLGNDFEVTRAYLGEESFDALAHDYIDANPSRFRNVRWFGDRFAGFMQSHPAHTENPMACDLARFEWSVGLAFDAADDTYVTFDELAGVSPEQWVDLTFTCHASFQIATFRTNAPDQWAHFKEHGAFTDKVALEEQVTYAIWRLDETPRFRPLSHDEVWAIRATQSGAGFGELCEGLCEFLDADEAPMRAATLINEWVRSQWLSGASVRT